MGSRIHFHPCFLAFPFQIPFHNLSMAANTLLRVLSSRPSFSVATTRAGLPIRIRINSTNQINLNSTSFLNSFSPKPFFPKQHPNCRSLCTGNKGPSKDQSANPSFNSSESPPSQPDAVTDKANYLDNVNNELRKLFKE